MKNDCHTRRHNDLEGHNNFLSTIYSFSILCLEHRQVHLFTSGGLGLKNLFLFTSLLISFSMAIPLNSKNSFTLIELAIKDILM